MIMEKARSERHRDEDEASERKRNASMHPRIHANLKSNDSQRIGLDRGNKRFAERKISHRFNCEILKKDPEQPSGSKIHQPVRPKSGAHKGQAKAEHCELSGDIAQSTTCAAMACGDCYLSPRRVPSCLFHIPLVLPAACFRVRFLLIGRPIL